VLTVGLVGPAAGLSDAEVDLLFEAAGFGVPERVAPTPARGGPPVVRAERQRTLPDLVGPGLRVLVCGINPSVYAADRGVPFARPGNRFWPAAVAAGLVDTERDGWRALTVHRIGFTDLVKRATPGAAELDPTELRHGALRLAWTLALVRPAVLCVVGLTAWRIAVDRAATAGPAAPFGATPVYVMPNPSGRNAHTSPTELVRHLRAVVRGPGGMDVDARPTQGSPGM